MTVVDLTIVNVALPTIGRALHFSEANLQLLVTRISAGPVMALGMALIAGGIVWATQVPVHGHFWSALAGPFFVAGAGTAFAFIPVSIAGLSGVTEQDAGLASGLLNTSQQLGGAIGVAIASTVFATHLGTLLGQHKPANVALTGGFQLALWVCGTIALLAIPVTAVLLRRTTTPAGLDGAASRPDHPVREAASH